MKIAEFKDFRVSEVAHAINVTPKALRNWLLRDGFTPDSDSADSWRSFSPYDVAVLAIVKHLVDFGISTKSAASMAADVLSGGIKTTLNDVRINPARLWAASLSATFLFAFKDEEGEWKYFVSQEWDTAQRAVLRIQIGTIINEAFKKIGIVTNASGEPQESES